MAGARLTLALGAGAVELPEVGRIAVFGPRAGADLSALPTGRLRVLTTMKPDYDYFSGLGYDCAVAPNGRFSASVIALPRAKLLARAMVAEACSVTDGMVIIDGAKTDGVESILKDIRRRVEISAPFSKAHGKVFAFEASDAFADWAGAPMETDGGFVTAPGVFSADAIDPASRYLADELPGDLGRNVVDLGAGWGYLSARALEREGIEALHLVEADHVALDCARRNVLDARAQFHWADATRWQAPGRVDTVIMNPPFHTGRAADPDLGRAFITAAAQMLSAQGVLWMVANRHLGYEPALETQFARVEELAGNARFKVLRAQRPTVKRR